MEEHLRILHLVHQYLPHYIGGTELYSRTVATAQAASGHNVAVFVPSPLEETFSIAAAVESGVRVYRAPLGERGRIQVFFHSFRQPQLEQNWKQVIEAERPDIVHVEHLMGVPFALLDALREHNIPYVISLHDYWYVCANAQLLKNTDQTICDGPDEQALNCAQCALARGGLGTLMAGSSFIAPLMKHRNSQAESALKQAGQIIAPTKFVRDRYLALVQDDLPVTVLPHGIDLPREAVEKAVGEWTRYDRDGRLHVGYIGSIAEQKGLHVLIAAVNTLPVDAITLSIYGDSTAFPQYTAELKRLVDHPGIELSGIVERKDLWRVLAGFDVVVAPTLWYETSVLVIDEANAVGVPVIGSEIGVMSERIADGVNGRLFPAGDVQALSHILSGLIAAPQELQKWRRNIQPVHTIEEHIRALEEIYAAALITV